MEFLIGYLLFALTTSSTSLIVLLQPVLKELKQKQPSNVLLENIFITYFVFLVLGTLIAPILFFSTVVPQYSEKFKESLLKSITS